MIAREVNKGKDTPGMVVVECVAEDSHKSSGAMSDVGVRGYFESAVVSLYSIRKTNPTAELYCVTNTDVPQDIARNLELLSCHIVRQAFDTFCFSKDLPWYLAYYKLCALKRILEKNPSDFFLLLDVDTWIRGPLELLVRDCPLRGVMMYDMHEPIGEKDRSLMHEELSQIVGREAPFAHFYGGEFIFGDRYGLEELLWACSEVMAIMEHSGHYSCRGDEFLYYAADAMGMMPEVRAANPYVVRCNTGIRYYRIASSWEDKLVLHLLREKVYGFPIAYRRLSYGCEIDDHWFCRVCGLVHARRPITLSLLVATGLRKVRHRLWK